jgi:Phosphoinositide phospholipase C, Ca2+-dependent
LPDAALVDHAAGIDATASHDAVSTIDGIVPPEPDTADAREAGAFDARIADAPIAIDGAVARDGGPTGPLTIEALQVIGTHNSYHKAPAIAFDASHKYTHLPLDQQLAGGVRGLELDLHLRSDGVFEVYHIAIIDPNTTCATFEECLGVIASWSGAHPTHVPIFIWLELKDDTGGNAIQDLVPIENVITKVFASDKLITSAWLKGSYPSPHDRILAAGWPTLQEAHGRVMFTIINRDDRTKAYAHDFTSLDDRIMFVNAAPDQLTMPWASITKVDSGQNDVVVSAHAAHLLVATNVCAVNMTDDACTMLLATDTASGIHMLHDDLPFPVSGRSYHAALPGGSPGCNPVTAPAGCMSNRLE